MVYKKCDLNGDGVLDKEEFKKMIFRHRLYLILSTIHRKDNYIRTEKFTLDSPQRVGKRGEKGAKGEKGGKRRNH